MIHNKPQKIIILHNIYFMVENVPRKHAATTEINDIKNEPEDNDVHPAPRYWTPSNERCKSQLYQKMYTSTPYMVT